MPNKTEDRVETVLREEARAAERLREAVSEKDEAIRLAQLNSNRIINRNEKRTTAAVEIAEQKSRELVIEELEQMNKKRTAELQRQQAQLEFLLPELINARVEEFWP